MDEERTRKIEKGLEKLAVYKRRKEKEKTMAGSSSSNDSSLSLSPVLLPETGGRVGGNDTDVEQISEASSISEHISSANSVENDRSYQEIEISNVPSHLSQILRESEDVANISQENRPSLTSEDSAVLSSAGKNARSILEEILRDGRFRSGSERLKSDSLRSGEDSLDIFEGVNLDDGSINEYVLRLRGEETPRAEEEQGQGTIENLRELLGAKESVIVALSAELDSMKEAASNQSTMSLNTTLTEYKQCQEECTNKIVEYKNALSHRDGVIENLTESLQQSVANEQQLRDDCERFAKDVQALRTELGEATDYIRNHQCPSGETVDHGAARKSPTEPDRIGYESRRSQNEEQLVKRVENVVNLEASQGVEDTVTSADQGLSKNEVKIDEATQTSDSCTIVCSTVAHSEIKLSGVDETDDCVAEVPFADEKIDFSELDDVCSKLEDLLTPAQVFLLDQLKTNINEYIQSTIVRNRQAQDSEIKILKDKLDVEKNESKKEIVRLRELLDSVRCGSTEIAELRRELELKYVREMEELRTYYEKKCSDMEKHYSDEVFSQQSRKMSGSSTGSEPEFASDLVFASQPPALGGGGDPGTPLRSKDFSRNLTKPDLLGLRKHVASFGDVLGRYDLENLSDDDFAALKSELNELDVKALLKVDLANLRSDLQAKYNAELEILRGDYEDRIDVLTVENEARRKAHDEQVEGLRYELEEAQRNVQMNINSAVQEVANSGEFELADIVKSYQLRLQDQVALAKIDIISALEHQMQMLAENPCDDSMWPDEFLQIRNHFTRRSEEEIESLKRSHEEEISRLKDEHLKTLNGALERARRRSLKDDSLGDMEIVKERNNLKRTSTVLRNLVAELLVYFTQCEDELNSTLVEELVKQNLLEVEPDPNNVSVSRRVHLTPNVEDLISLVETASFDSKEVSLDFRSELVTCLDRLKSEANAVLAMTASLKDRRGSSSSEDKVKSLEERITSLTRQMITDSQIKEDLSVQLAEARDFVRSLEAERQHLERHSEELVAKNCILSEDLGKARDKIGELVECGRKEVVSEGYGENDRMGLQGGSVSRATLSDLRERARVLASKPSTKPDDPFLPLVEEFCREGDRLVDDAKRERDDYLLQIEVADKKLRATTQFLEEQAVEREQERDEAQKDIAVLREQLRERDKDRASYERISREKEHCPALTVNPCCRHVHEEIVRTVEQLESQMRDMQRMIEEGEARSSALDVERQEAVDKIWVLRDIITDLEGRVDKKTTVESELRDIVAGLEEVVGRQREANEELAALLEAGANGAGYASHIGRLEEEVGRLRLANELAGNEGVLKHLRMQLHEIESTIDKATQELESLHASICMNSCSSPSEEMSIRDQIRPQTPTSLEDCDVPLQQLARLKEKLLKHSRAEHAAIKRIHDVEMQLVSTKHEHDELQNERDVLQEQVSEQLVLISSLQMRLDDQRIRTEHVQKQTNASLEVRIYDLENDVQNLRDTLHARENVIKQLQKTIEQTNKLLKEREQELCSSADENALVDLQTEVERLKAENELLRVKMESDAQNAQLLPGLVDNILADKNRDIDCLRQRLSDTEKQLDLYLSLNLDRESLKKSDERGLMSFVNFANPEQLRKENRKDTLELSAGYPVTGNYEPEVSSIERIGSPHINYTMHAPLPKPNSTEIYKSGERRVHFEESHVDEVKELKEKIAQLETDAENLIGLREKDGSELQKLRTELAELETRLAEGEKAMELLVEDVGRRDDMYFYLAKEKRDVEKVMSTDNESLKQELKTLAEENEKLKRDLSGLDQLEAVCRELHVKEKDMREELDAKVDELKEKNTLNSKLVKEIGNKTKQLDAVSLELKELGARSEEHVKRLQDKIEKQNAHIEALKADSSDKEDLVRMKALLDDRECELEILNEDIVRYQNDVASLESKLKSQDESGQLKFMKQRKEVAERDLEIVKLKTAIGDLKKEIIHLQDYLNEKDKMIAQMKTDGESLRVNLEAIKRKMDEAGNVMELRDKLHQEIQTNAALRSELGDKNVEAVLSIDDLSEQVRRHFDDSENLDESIMNALNSGEYARIEDIEVLRRAIDRERKRNADLLNRKTKLESQIKELDEKLAVSSNSIRELQTQLENERKLCTQIQIEDANLLENLRLKLETALENENEFEAVLNEEKRKRATLEAEITALRQKRGESLSTSSVSKTEYKSLPDTELTRIKAEIEALTRENEKLKKELKSAKKARDEATSGLKYTKDLLNLRTKELEKAEATTQKLREEVQQEREKFVDANEELEQKSREVENSRAFIEELEQERLEMKAEVDRVSEKIRALEEEKVLRDEAHANRDAGMSSPVPEKFLQKMKELGDLVSVLIRENKGMTDSLLKLTDERDRMQQKINEMEEVNENRLPFDDPAARANHLFGKYLRADSYRNALAWQKKYLIRLLATYQDFRALPVDPLKKFEPKNRKPARSRGAQKFRSAVCVVIAVLRMKFMVQRWHSGTRGGCYTSLQRKFKTANPQLNLQAHFQVGQPVSSQHFRNGGASGRFVRDTGHVRVSPYEVPRASTPPRQEALPLASGFTPPTKEKTIRPFQPSVPSTSGEPALHPMQTAEIAKCLERFDMIHQRLGMAFETNDT